MWKHVISATYKSEAGGLWIPVLLGQCSKPPSQQKTKVEQKPVLSPLMSVRTVFVQRTEFLLELRYVMYLKISVSSMFCFWDRVKSSYISLPSTRTTGIWHHAQHKMSFWESKNTPQATRNTLPRAEVQQACCACKLVKFTSVLRAPAATLGPSWVHSCLPPS